MRNKNLAEQFRGKPCVVCGQPGELDHIRAYARNPARDVEQNGWSVCRPHHTEKHKIGLTKFVEKYRLWHELEARGFYYCELTNKYRHEGF